MALGAYQIVEGDEEDGFEAYGQAVDFWRYKGPEVMLSGPAETGKTRTALEKLDALMWKYPGAQAAIIRKTRQSMTGSVLQTYQKKVLGPDTPVRAYGGSHVEWYDYPTGSRVFVGGMDNPGKVLSSERDVILVNQAEELHIDEWETLTTRATGRAGNMPYAQLMGDCNPSEPKHWILGRAGGGGLRLFESRHEDNPTLFDPLTGQLTEQGARTLSVLDRLTGARKQRLRYGKWVSEEGQIYEEYDTAVHLIDPFVIPPNWPRYRTIDFGYTNPFVCQWWAADNDGRLFMYRELYGTGRLVQNWAEYINVLSAGERYEWTVSDHDAEDRATLHASHIGTKPAPKDVSPGIQAVQVRLRRAGDGRARLFLLRDALVEADESLRERRLPVCTAEEFPSYVWAKSADGRVIKEQPQKRDDHGMDAMRYLVYKLDGPSPTGETHVSNYMDGGGGAGVGGGVGSARAGERGSATYGTNYGYEDAEDDEYAEIGASGANGGAGVGGRYY